MKILALLIATISLCLARASYIPPLQTAKGNIVIAGGTCSAAFGSGIGSHLIVVIVTQTSSTNIGLPSSVLSDKSDAPTGDVTLGVVGAMNLRTTMYYFAAPTAGAVTFTATWGSNVSTASIAMAEYPMTSGALDKDAVATSTGSTAPASGSTATTTVASELVVGVLGTNNAVTPSNPSPSSDFTYQGVPGAGFSDTTQSSTQTWAASYTLSVSEPWLCGVFTFHGNALATPTGGTGLTLGVG